MSHFTSASLIMFAVAALGITPAQSESHFDATDSAPPTSIMDFVEASPDHTNLAAALRLARLSEMLAQPGDYTLFAPTDSAFATLPPSIIPLLLRPLELAEILRCNVVDGAQLRQDMLDEIDADGRSTTVSPQAWCASAAIRADDSVRIYDNFGASARVTVADQVQSNGVVHVTDSFLLPDPSDIAIIAAYPDTDPNAGQETGEAGPDGQMREDRTIIENLRNVPELSKFLQMIEATDWAERLDSEGSFTLITPNNAAFASISEGEFSRLLEPEQSALLTKLVGSHILRRTLDLDDLRANLSRGPRNFFHTSAETGDAVSIFAAGNAAPRVFDESGRSYDVIEKNLAQSNGVIHVIGGILRPR